MAGAEIGYTGMGQWNYPAHISYTTESLGLLTIPTFTMYRLKIIVLSRDIVVTFEVIKGWL
jgi:hypothetical protein